MRVPRWALQCVLAAALASALVSCGSGTGAGRADPGAPGRVEDRLEQIAAGAARPIYYLGQRFRDWPLAAVLDDVPGRVDAIYGTCDSESCAPPVDLINEALDPVKWSQAVGCSRLPPVRGVPAVHFGDALVLLTGVSLITLGVLADDTQTAIAAAEQLRPVGEAGPGGALPAPDPDALRVLTIACGQLPGDAGPTLSEPGGDAAQDVHVPDFTVERLGGGTLRWAAYRGKPVVVVVGDVPDVVDGIRRVIELRGGASPAVIGLVWKPFGSKSAPAPIKQIESEAGNLPVPVGYAAIPRPAVWFFDIAEASPAQTGVIAFVNADGDLVHHLRTDAPDAAIADALRSLPG